MSSLFSFISSCSIFFLPLLKNVILLCGKTIYRQQYSKRNFKWKLPPHVGNKNFKTKVLIYSRKENRNICNWGVIVCFHYPNGHTSYFYLKILIKNIKCVWVTLWLISFLMCSKIKLIKVWKYLRLCVEKP